MDRKSKFVANGTIGGMEASNDLEEELDEEHSVFCTTNISTCHPNNKKKWHRKIPKYCLLCFA